MLSPDQITLLPSAALDLVVMHSVAQYLSAEELDGLLSLFHRLLRSNGDFILGGDVIPPGGSAATDALALLRFAMGNGFFAAAVFGLARTLASPYWPLRSLRGSPDTRKLLSWRSSQWRDLQHGAFLISAITRPA